MVIVVEIRWVQENRRITIPMDRKNENFFMNCSLVRSFNLRSGLPPVINTLLFNNGYHVIKIKLVIFLKFPEKDKLIFIHIHFCSIPRAESMK